ncbi:MAG: hypothetical protein ACYCXA_11645, partial [Actinomycetes bacterium]
APYAQLRTIEAARVSYATAIETDRTAASTARAAALASLTQDLAGAPSDILAAVTDLAAHPLTTSPSVPAAVHHDLTVLGDYLGTTCVPPANDTGTVTGVPVATTVAYHPTGVPSGAHVSVQVVRVSGLANDPAAQAADAAVTRAAQNLVTTFVAAMAAAHATDGALQVRPAVTLLTPGWLSLRLDAAGNIAGALQPYRSATGVTMSLSTGAPVGFAGLFAPRSDYLTVVSQLARKMLTMQFGHGSFDFAAPSPANYRVFDVTNSGLEVTFLDAPARYGAPRVYLPGTALNSVADFSGPMGAP